MDGNQGPTTNTVTSPISVDLQEHHSKIALFVLVPVLFVLIVVFIVLSVCVYLAVRKREKKQHAHYQPVPTKSAEDSAVDNKLSTLPYPPSVKISKSSYPHLEYSLATQLPQPLEVNSTRYPFIQHQLPGPRGSIHETRPPRLRTKRRGNHKHGRGKHVILGKQETVDSDHSPTPEPEGAKLCQLPVRRESSSPETPSTSSKPEITLVFKYDELDGTLVIKINQVLNLPLREDGSEVDGYVRLHFTPALIASTDVGTVKTHTRRKSSSPVFQEELTYTNIKKDQLPELTLHIEVMDYKSYGKHNVLVQTEIQMMKLKFFDGNCKLTLPLEPPKYVGECNGVVFLSLCFDAVNKKLSVIILRAKDLNDGRADETDPLAKISITINDRLVAKLRTKKKPSSSSPIFNEAVSCVADLTNIHEVQIVVTLQNERKHGKHKELGRVVLGSKESGNQLRHWNDAITAPGKHIAEWHDLVCTPHIS